MQVTIRPPLLTNFILHGMGVRRLYSGSLTHINPHRNKIEIGIGNKSAMLIFHESRKKLFKLFQLNVSTIAVNNYNLIYISNLVTLSTHAQ